MYPNPQDALPLPPRPSLEQYRKLAKDLVKRCRSGNPAAIQDWALRWIQGLAELQESPTALGSDREIQSAAGQVSGFAQKKLSGSDRSASCALTDAQFVLARAHGFLSWPKFVTQIESLASESSPASLFEAAASAIVAGDSVALERLLHEHPDLIHMRSLREHRATLLHYVSANGVEGYRQLSPKNIAGTAERLLAAGAEVDAEADVYGGRCTALGLVATSTPPLIAGVQRGVIDVLLAHGARMDVPGIAGHRSSLIRACLANGQPDAAEYLVSRGAPLDLAAAAGLGRVDVLTGFFDTEGRRAQDLTPAVLKDAFSLACGYGRTAAAEFLLDHGVAADEELSGHGEGHTGLHVAAFHGHVAAVEALLRRGARIDAIDKTWGTPPLIWALTGWSRKGADAGRYHQVVARLVAAGAVVTPDLIESARVRADPVMLAALEGRLAASPQDGSDRTAG